MRWLIAPTHNDPVALSVDFQAFSPSGDEGRTTLVHWTHDAVEIAESLDVMLLDAPLELPGRLWRRHLEPPHDRSLERLKAVLDELFATAAAVQVTGPPTPSNAAVTWHTLGLDLDRSLRAASAATGDQAPEAPPAAVSATNFIEHLSTLRDEGALSPELGDEVHAHLAVIADRRRAPFRGVDDPATMHLRLAADALDHAARLWLSHRVRTSRK